jgi:RNA polymerase sigma factor (sigma-70 family)
MHLSAFAAERGIMDSQKDFSIIDTEQRQHVFALIKKAQDGSNDAYSELKDIYSPLIEGKVAKFSSYDMTSQDIEDLRQEVLVQFCNAVCNYDLSLDGVEFGLYAKICIENRLVSYIRSFKRRKDKSTLLLEGEVTEASGYTDPAQDIIDKERFKALVSLIEGSLSDYESRVWWLYVSGISVSEIAKKLGVNDPKSVTNAIYRIRKKLRSRIGEA